MIAKCAFSVISLNLAATKDHYFFNQLFSLGLSIFRNIFVIVTSLVLLHNYLMKFDSESCFDFHLLKGGKFKIRV